MPAAHWLHPHLQGASGQGRNRLQLPLLQSISPSQRALPHRQGRLPRGTLRSPAQSLKRRPGKDVVCDGQQPSHPLVPSLVRLHPRQPQPEQGSRLRRHRRPAGDQGRRVHFGQEHPHLPEGPQQHLQCTRGGNQLLPVLKHRLKKQRKSRNTGQLIGPLRSRHPKGRTGQLLQVLPQQIQPLLLTQ